MLNTLMKTGGYRIDYFDDRENNPLYFGFYIRGEKSDLDAYSRDVKSQLYTGLLLIQSKHERQNLRGIYLDVDSLDNIQRPAYVQLKADLINGLFRRIFVLDESALLGTTAANDDLLSVYLMVGGFELIVCRDGECVAVDIFSEYRI